MGGSHNVAVIGAGVAGLIAARELQNEGHRVVIFEKSDKLGGLWVYDSRVESDELGYDPTREIIHSSVYKSLRTNLPRVLMEFSGFGFADRQYGDPRTFPGHQEVLEYLNDFAIRYRIIELIRFESEVIRVERVGDRVDSWLVEWQVKEEGRRVKLEQEVFEAVVICNGHCTVPRVARIPGIEKWPGKQIHSHNYRVPEPFHNQVVVIIGNGASAYDISRDISKAAKEVHVSSRSPNAKFSKLDHYHNIWQHSSIADAKQDGTITFDDGSSVQASIIMHCTGYFCWRSIYSVDSFHRYKYECPFLNTNGIVSIDDNRVGPLYKHVFPPELGPWLSFVGLPQKILIFDTMELQSKWIAIVLSDQVRLPEPKKMMEEVHEYYEQMKLLKRPKHLTHYLLNPEEYLDCLAAEAGISPLEDWRKEVYRETVKNLENQQDFRDV
ncbi:flavin-containing monooxygenase FMO GS-OX-like 3 isoform X1 [Silene latifolia]|uniref:flavin-containing monooxygenase FMO GS-OX-like 3 isoform X1 n=1 Tax=Silene latifolia TaxID=37657 RepID=UPI003D76C2C6